MKILFLNPPRFHELVGKNPSVIEHNRGYNPPLGVLSLATAVKASCGDKHHVEALDCQPRQLDYDQLRHYFTENQFDVVGVTAMTFTLIDVVKTVRVIKETNPDCVTVLGGPHVHLFPKESINLENVDYLVQGEGEIAILELLKMIEGELPKSSVSGLVYRDGEHICNNGIAPKIEDLDSIPYPDRRFLPIDHYGSLLARGNRITTTFTSRGCPYRCTFCDRPMSPTISGFRWRSAKSVVDEMEDCKSLGIEEFFIYDDTFSVRKDRVYEICDEILARNLMVTWDVRAHVNTVDEKLLRAMKSAGCDRIHYGVECGNDRMLKVIRKNTTVKRITETFAATKKAGIEALAYFMIGQQTETLSDIHDTMALSKKLNADYCHFTIFCPYPGTEIYNLGLERGVIKTDVWREFAENPRPGFSLPVWEENFTRAELYGLIVKMYKGFYTRPAYLVRKFLTIRSFGEFSRKAKGWIGVIGMKPAEVAKLDLSKAKKVK